MQETLKKAARWYIAETGFSLSQMEEDLYLVIKHRAKAFHDGDMQKVYKVFAYTEIIKAAICLVTNQEYETSFSKMELSLIKRLSKPTAETFVCRKCGKEYPAEAFANDTRYSNNLSRYCIACAREISSLKREKNRRCKTRSGYINQTGAIICSCC